MDIPRMGRTADRVLEDAAHTRGLTVINRPALVVSPLTRPRQVDDAPSVFWAEPGGSTITAGEDPRRGWLAG